MTCIQARSRLQTSQSVIINSMYLVVEHVQRSRNTFWMLGSNFSKNICTNRSYIYRCPFVATALSCSLNRHHGQSRAVGE